MTKKDLVGKEELKTLDMREANGYNITEFDVVKKALLEDGKYRKDLLYRGFDGRKISRLLKTGQDTNSEFLFCYTESQIEGPYAVGSEANIFGYAYGHPIPAVAVFDPLQLESDQPVGEFAYKFKNPDKKLEALVAVYKLKY